VRISGFPLDSSVTINASTQDDAGSQWTSQATFSVQEDGTVDLRSQRPLTGSYDRNDSMGLLWSMTARSRKGKQESSFVKTDLTVPTTITLRAQVNDEIFAIAKAERLHQAEGVTEVRVQEQDLIGKLFLPADSGPHPGLLVLSGSDGIIRERAAALFASHGYATLALVYFGVKNLPKRLARVPLEYFEKGIHWLQNRPEVATEQIGVIGSSRGGELALLLGATFPQIKAVVASAPSGLIHGGVGTAPSVPAWTYHDVPLPHIAYKPAVSELVDLLSAMMRRVPFVGRPLYLKELSDKKAVERATIPVEKIHSPILLISGEEDELWPSTIYAEMVMEHLKQHHYPYPYKHLRYKEAGHIIGLPYSFPYLPPTTPFSGGPVLLAFGGRLDERAQADSDSWIQTLAFFNEHLKVQKE
jgi:dienelactone hydrolase